MNNYIRISNQLYSEFEKVFKKQEECELVYLDKNNCTVNIKSKILNIFDIHGDEYMSINENMNVRLDKITYLNGEETKVLNHY